ncbi:hypothetical protein [Acidovorax soli]|uniref:DUF2946 domain-containing protein n=1 Tax=Acidovorax soli TaxID=592050 RepID=A0A1H4CCX7_9BURK|nr:hypothetical protein [Acidovorax soli]SEA58173.1 hypothetical protein SAMN05421875_11865 [Acidovorax soli]
MSLPAAPPALSALQATARRAGVRGRWLQQLSARAALVWLLLALVIAPTVGRLHEVAHGGRSNTVHAGPAPQAAAHHGGVAGAHAADTGTGLLQALWGDHAAPDCLLLDQLALGDALHSAPMALPAVVPVQARLAYHPEPVLLRWFTPFQARGPPVA